MKLKVFTKVIKMPSWKAWAQIPSGLIKMREKVQAHPSSLVREREKESEKEGGRERGSTRERVRQREGERVRKREGERERGRKREGERVE